MAPLSFSESTLTHWIQRMFTPPQRWGLAAILLLAALLRFLNLDQTSFWIDEIHTLMVAHAHLPPDQIPERVWTAQEIYDRYLQWQPLTWSSLLDMLKVNVHMPLYYLFINPWMHWFGSSEAGLRSFSALCSVLMILPIYALGCALGNRKVGLFAALITALAPFQLYFAQEGRMYSLSLFWTACSSLALWKLLYGIGHHRLWAVLYTLALIGGTLTHYMFVFVLGFQGLYAIAECLRKPQKRHLWLGLPLSILILVAMAWAPIYQIQKQGLDQEYHFAKGLVGWNRYLTVLIWQPLIVVAGDNYGVRAWYMPLTAGLLLFSGAWLWLKKQAPTWRREGFLLCWLWLPLLLHIGYDVLNQSHSVVIDRYSLWIAPAVYLGMALGCERLLRLPNGKFWLAPILAGMTLVSLANVWSPSPLRDEHNKKDSRGKLTAMARHATNQDLLIVNGPFGASLLAAYYLTPLQPERPLLWWSRTHAQREFNLPPTPLLTPYESVWLFSYRNTRHRGPRELNRYLKQHYRPLTHTLEGHTWPVFERPELSDQAS